MITNRKRLRVLFAATLLACAAPSLWPQKAHAADDTLLNASYDVARAVYQALDPAFEAQYKSKTGRTVKVNQSHGGSTKQARSVIDGLEADVVTMNSPLDIDMIADRGKLLPKDWATHFPHASSPSWSAIVFVVRKGNPKGLRDWGDLVKPGVGVVMPNPKTSGNGRYSYLAAWEWAKRNGGGKDDAGRTFVTALLSHVPVLDTGGRGATTTFAQRGVGDVLLTFENEAHLVRAELGDGFEIVVPSLTIRADNPVAVVEKYASKHGTTDLAHAFLEWHFSAEAQEIFAKNAVRPVDDAVLARHAADFPALNVFTVEQAFGGWSNTQATHFADGGEYDRIFAAPK